MNQKFISVAAFIALMSAPALATIVSSQSTAVAVPQVNRLVSFRETVMATQDLSWNEVFSMVRFAIREIKGIPVSVISGDHVFETDLFFDSVDILELADLLEYGFDLLPGSVITYFTMTPKANQTVAGVVSHICYLLSE